MLGFVGFIKKNLDMQGKLPDKWKDAVEAVEDWGLTLNTDGTLTLSPVLKFYRAPFTTDTEYFTVQDDVSVALKTSGIASTSSNPGVYYYENGEMSGPYSGAYYYLEWAENYQYSVPAESSNHQAYIYAWHNSKQTQLALHFVIECTETTSDYAPYITGGCATTAASGLDPIAKITWNLNDIVESAFGNYYRITKLEKL